MRAPNIKATGLRTTALILVLGIVAAGCSSQAAASASTAAATAGPSGSGGSAATVMAASAGSAGTVLVAGSNGMTVYTYTSDVANSGKSACSGSCAKTWPPLTIASGATPMAGSGASGKVGTITRDDGSLQVTYNGLPLYFFSGDTKPGDTNGHYTGWNLVTP